MHKLSRNILSAAILAGLTSQVAALNIVLTNDDGFETPNIQILYSALVAAGHDVILSAPFSGQSGTSGQIAFLRPIGPSSEPSEAGLLPAGSYGIGETTIATQQYYVNGSPTAAALYGMDVKAQDIWGARPDLLISGPNEGNNLGVITPHSGTVGATVTALNKGIPAVAVSAKSGDPEQAEVVADLVVKLVDALDGPRGVKLPQSIGLNVNMPAIDVATQSADDFTFTFTRIGTSSTMGLQFYEALGESPVAVGFGIPPETTLPGVSVEIPATLAGYPEDDSRHSESNVLGPKTVTVSVIQGTYAADRPTENKVKAKLMRLFHGHREYGIER
ncbi:MAG: 5'/3'-nucleotidase SurE [Gammaproteobacteria bacterium]|nr:5'/3'-nucleotidase SurE [Gammaproteobacteria bacterium]MBQ0839199.1 5'/3'-nucleotidase SurE [Gammaproteobacteria bacterium]